MSMHPTFPLPAAAPLPPPQAAPQQPCKADLEALEALTCLRFAAWPQLPAAAERRPAPASTGSHSQHSGSELASEQQQQQQQQRQQRQALAGSRRPRSAVESEDEEGHDAESRHRPAQRKQRAERVLLPPGAAALQRRTYTWRGLHSRRAEKQQRQLEALAATHQPQQQPQPGEQQQQQPQPQPLQQQAECALSSGSAPGSPAAPAAPLALPTAAAASAASTQKEGDREFAALTTWLRMNIHNPRTAKKVVPFVGRRDPAAAGQRWAFSLNPALAWADVSPDMRRRLRHLPQEAAQAFARKYPARRPEDWRLKSQKYKPPGSSQTHLVLLEDLVAGLHGVWLAHEGGQAAAATSAAAAESADAAAAAIAPACPGLASCGSSALAAAGL